MDAKQLDNNPVKMGQMLSVENQLKKPTANSKYVALHVEDEKGDNERCLLFTEIELADMEKIVLNFAQEDMVMGRIYPVVIGGKDTNLVKVKNGSGTEMILRLSPSQLKVAEARRERNPEDLPKKGFLTDLLD